MWLVPASRDVELCTEAEIKAFKALEHVDSNSIAKSGYRLMLLNRTMQLNRSINCMDHGFASHTGEEHS